MKYAMSGGGPGLAGHIYQQRLLAFRVLSSLAAARLPEYTGQDVIVEFAVEGRDESTAPVWDVRFRLEDERVHLRECKDTAITKPDRAIFYHRIRKELQAGTAPSQLTVGWVTDADKQQGNILYHFSGMVKLAVAEVLAVPVNRPQEVTSARTALEEAVYCLCSDSTEKDAAPPLLLEDAKDLLSRVKTERYRMQDLEDAVKLLAEGTFTAGTGETIGKYILGEFAAKILPRQRRRVTPSRIFWRQSTSELLPFRHPKL